jgi:uncharacterized protein with NAD-binding domain and iron-sulfur cluster
VVTRERAATFRGAPGTAALRPASHTSVPGLFLAGAWCDTGWPATMEGAVQSGNTAARAVLDDQGQSQHLSTGVRATAPGLAGRSGRSVTPSRRLEWAAR